MVSNIPDAPGAGAAKGLGAGGWIARTSGGPAASSTANEVVPQRSQEVRARDARLRCESWVACSAALSSRRSSGRSRHCRTAMEVSDDERTVARICETRSEFWHPGRRSRHDNHKIAISIRSALIRDIRERETYCLHPTTYTCRSPPSTRAIPRAVRACENGSCGKASRWHSIRTSYINTVCEMRMR